MHLVVEFANLCHAIFTRKGLGFPLNMLKQIADSLPYPRAFELISVPNVLFEQVVSQVSRIGKALTGCAAIAANLFEKPPGGRVPNRVWVEVFGQLFEEVAIHAL